LASIRGRCWEVAWEAAWDVGGNTRSIAMPSANLRREIREGWRLTEDSLNKRRDVD
jgi:hypothetical protein